MEPLNKGHFGGNSFVLCREVVPISEGPLFGGTSVSPRQLTKDDLRGAVETRLDVRVDSLVVIATGAEINHLD